MTSLSLLRPLCSTCLVSIGLLLFFAAISAADPDALPSPLEPKEALKHFVVPEGLEVQLVASEPNIVDPVAMRFDENGRLWVVEMCDYPDTSVTGPDARSRLSVLDDRDSDGFYETAAVVADDLRYATGVQPWKGGAFVTVAGEVIYLKDTDGDDRANVRETWYRGFSEKNQQLRANHPRLSIDGHIYVANGLRGGDIVDAQKPKSEPLSISGMDFRFHPVTRKFEAVSGVGQFGLTFDDFNNRFVCSNRNPAIHVVLEDQYLKKNPLVAVPAVSIDVAKAGAGSKLYPIGRAFTTSHLHAGQFTAACGLDVFRGDALPEIYHGSLFVCDPTAHLVHREVMQPKGVTFSSTSGEDKAEFMASRDEWFSPCNIETGPDGALYVVDMYRAVIEHPEWMPLELRNRPDLLEGLDRGRIYRVVAKGRQRPEEKPALSNLPSQSLVEKLAHPNGWWRETAGRLLLERQDKSIAPQLREVAWQHESSLARIHALRLLQSLDSLDEELLLHCLDDSNPRIVEQAIVASEPLLKDSAALKSKVSSLATADDARVRFQALLTATPLPPVPAHATDQWELNATLIAAGNQGGEVLATMLSNPEQLKKNIEKPEQFVAQLARLAAASDDQTQRPIAVKALVASDDFSAAGLASLFAEVVKKGATIEELRTSLDESTNRELDAAFATATTVANDTERKDPERTDAINLLAFAGDAAETLTNLALDDASQAVRLRAILALARSGQVEAWQQLLENFSGETPAVQRGIVDAAAVNAECSRLLLGELIAGRIKPTEIDLTRANKLLQTLFADSMPKDREKALEDYRAALKLTADPIRGQKVFEKNCSICHRVNNVGVEVAPDISDSRERLPEQLLADIIQPNRAIDSNYFSYTVVTADGLTHNGILTAETSTSVTLKQAEGKTLTLARDEIEDLSSDGISYMPDGLEKNITPQEMADLIAFIKNWRYISEAPGLVK